MWLTNWMRRKPRGSDLQALTLVVQDLNSLLRVWLNQQGVVVPTAPKPFSPKERPRKRLASDVKVITRDMVWEQEQKAAQAEQQRREGRLPS